MPFLSREEILKVAKRQFNTVMVPELGGEVRLISASAQTQSDINDLSEGKSANRDMMIFMLEKSIVDDDGRQVLDTASATELYGKMSLESVNLIIQGIPGFGKKKSSEVIVTAVPSETAPSAS